MRESLLEGRGQVVFQKCTSNPIYTIALTHSYGTTVSFLHSAIVLVSFMSLDNMPSTHCSRRKGLFCLMGFGGLRPWSAGSKEGSTRRNGQVEETFSHHGSQEAESREELGGEMHPSRSRPQSESGPYPLTSQLECPIALIFQNPTSECMILWGDIYILTITTMSVDPH